MMFIGGCAGSTGGGIKVVRIVTLFKLSVRELKRLIYPRSVFHLWLNKMVVRKDIISVITGFVFLYIFTLLITTVVVAAGGYDILSSFSTALVTVGNIGPGFNLVGPTMNYSFFQPGIKWFLSLAMMMGRLEIYTVMVLFIPHFWKKL
jgi:trk system potassium uptake protein TrkH